MHCVKERELVTKLKQKDMCLATKNLKPFIAKEDIKVFKILTKRDGEYSTPYQQVKVKLGTTMKPKEEVNFTEGNCGEKNCGLYITRGFIHAVLDASKYVDYPHDKVAIEAYIPKGTEFYIGDNLNEICTKELYLTENEYPVLSGIPYSEQKELIKEYIIDEYVSKENVSIGWFCTSDKKFIHPYDVNENNKNNIIGIVCGESNNEWQVMSLKQSTEQWAKTWNSDSVKGLVQCRDVESSLNDMDGKHNTEMIIKDERYKDGFFPAAKWCLEYKTKGTKKGDWYLPSCGELWHNMLRNIFILNAVMKYSSVGVELDTCYIYWSSTESSSYYARTVSTGSGCVNLDYNKNNNNYVRAWLRVERGE